MQYANTTTLGSGFRKPLDIYSYIQTEKNNSDPEVLRSMAKNFDLTEENFERLKQLLKEGDESLFEQIFFKHFQDCRNFLCKKYKCTQEIAYDITMDTMLVFRKKLILDKVSYGNLRYLFTKMASHQYINTKTKLKRETEVPSIINRSNAHINEDDIRLVNICLEKLGESCQNLLKQFYYEELSLKDIAKVGDKSYAAIRKQKERCVTKLRTLFDQYSRLF